MPDTERPEPPRHLSPDSRRLWRDVLASFELEPAELKTLDLALIALDRAHAARRAIRREGMLVADRFGQSKPHPAVAIEERARMDFLKLMRALALPYEETDAEPQARNAHGRFGPRGGQGRRARDKSAPGLEAVSDG